ncbi:hypothetical protein FNV43_RR26935 [Rhamnella rubrinervis]|uniref:Uncharacterized protein n=1 Tax=Rhamnella rubrinervis TaxID=2594499 RepID=A0A8K0DNZ3_9ROSA|nr:hypothetical protein FNV43_RR26935 [Rhamnella rubrinervis]
MPKSFIDHLLSTVFLASIILINFPRSTVSDDPCPYPCYPPPTGSGTPTTPSTTTSPPPPTPTQTGVLYPPPAGYSLYNPPPPDGGSFGGSAPPPPDPILPYFPFYFKKPLHGVEVSSASTLGSRSAVMIATATNLVALFLCSCVLYHFV